MKRFPLAPVAALGTVTLGKMVNNGKGESRGGDVRPYLRAANIQPFGVVNPGAHGNEMWFSDAEMDSLNLIKGDVLVVEGGAAGRTSVLREDLPGWGFQNSIVRVRVPHGDGRFLAYALQSAHDQGLVSIQTNVSTIPHFSAEKVSRFRVPTTSPNAQRRIADYLDAETAQIDGMLADLDVLVGHVTEQQRRLAGHTFAPFKSHSATVALVADVTLGKMLDEKKGVGDETPYLRAANVKKDNGLNLDDIKSMKMRPEERAKFDLRAGDILMVEGGDAGRVAFVHDDLPGVAFQKTLMRIRARPDLVGPEYLFHALNNAHQEGRIKVEHTVSTIPHFPAERLLRLPVPVPTHEEQSGIVRRLNDMRAHGAAMIADANRLKELLIERRAALITDVITGKKEVPA